MLARVVVRCAAGAKRGPAPLVLAVRRLATGAAGDASTAATVSDAGSMLAAVGRDIPLKVVPREARRQARHLAKKGTDAGQVGVRTASLPSRISLAVLGSGITGGIVWFFLEEGVKSQIASSLDKTFLGDVYAFASKKIEEAMKPWTDPSRTKLLPDWPIPQVPANTPPVPVLVLDLEDTLVHSEWSRKHGWRHAKRPGVDEFLETLCQYYEIVIFSQNYGAEEIVAKLDPKQCALHVLSRDATRYLNGAHVKDLSGINRDLQQVVIIDDDPAAYQLQPENAIPIRPFTDGRDREDHELKDLIPFLKALASERVADFRTVLSEFRDDDGVIRDVASKYAARVRALEMQQEQARHRGIGGFIRGRLPQHPHAPPSSGVGSVHM